MEWNKIYITGIKEIDEQHKELFDTIVSLKKIDLNNVEISKILKYLVDYTVFHFSKEEEYMKSINYSEINEHKKIHDRFLSELQSIIFKFEKQGTLAKHELYLFLIKWLQGHIAIEDQKYVEFKSSHETVKKNTISFSDIPYIISPQLLRIDMMLSDNLISKDIFIHKRDHYLKTFYKKFKIDNLSKLIKSIDSIHQLKTEEIISKDESIEIQKYLISLVNVEEMMNKETDREIKTKILKLML